MASASLLHYNALRPPKIRAARAAFAFAFRLGMGSVLARDRLVVAVSDEIAEDQRARVLLTDHLSEVLGRHVEISSGIGPPTPYRKPVLQVLSDDGRVVAFVKIGGSDATRRQLETEGQALRLIAGADLPHVRAPRLLARTVWRGMDVSVSEPLPSHVRRHRPWAQPPLEATREILTLDEVRSERLGDSEYARKLLDEIHALPVGSLEAPTVHRFADDVFRRFGDMDLAFGRCHGDWTPWNLARLADEVYALDWEHTRTAPVGIDVVNFLFYTSFVDARRGGEQRGTLAVMRSGDLLRELDVSEHARVAVQHLYVLETYLRHERAVVQGGAADPTLRATLLRTMRWMDHAA